MQNEYSLRKVGETYLISLIGQSVEKSLDQPPLSIDARLEVRIGQASKSTGKSVEELRQTVESGLTIYWK